MSKSDSQYDLLAGIIDLSRYPLHQPQSNEWAQLVEQRRADLERQQFCTLPGFLLEQPRRQIVAAVQARLSQANRADSERNVYLERSRDLSLPDDHPRNILSRGCYHMFGAHLLEDESPLKALYQTSSMQAFIAAIVGVDRLYPSADPYQPVNVLCHGEGDRSAWHFDSGNAFTMTLMLQAAIAGGEFEIVPNIRSDEDANIDGLRQLLQGDNSGVVRVAREPGELVIFRGCHSAHRVTPVEGERRRLMCVMVYEKLPGVTGDPVVNETVYGIRQT